MIDQPHGSTSGDPETHLVVAIAQSRSLVGQVQENLATASILCAAARRQGADLVLFPECHVSGYSYLDLAGLVRRTAEPIDGPIGNRLRELAAKNDLAVCCGMFEEEEGRFFNTHLIAFPDGRLSRQRKGLPSTVEEGVLCADEKRLAFEWRGVRFGILVCADIAMEGWEDQFKKLGISLLLHPSAGTISRDEQSRPDAYLQASGEGLSRAGQLARENNVFYAVANPIGFSGEDLYPGNSWIVDPIGNVLVRQPAMASEEGMVSSLGVASLRIPAGILHRQKDSAASQIS